MINLPQNKKIILFDGICNLCDSAVQFVIQRDKHDEFRFVALQSDLGQEILKHIGIDQKKVDSIIFYTPGIAYFTKASAVIEIAKYLEGFIWITSLFRIFPAGFSNRIYDFVAKNRYSWFGKKDQCMVPSPEVLEKFL